jgi:hypothetical protein
MYAAPRKRRAALATNGTARASRASSAPRWRRGAPTGEARGRPGHHFDGGGPSDDDRLAEERLQREEFFSSLRLAGVTQLGQVARAYIEPSGHISVLKCASPRPGRPLLPSCDPDPPTVYACGATPPEGGDFACEACGFCISVDAVRPLEQACSRCGHTDWLRAVEA